MRIGYARISEEDRSPPVQRHAFLAGGCGQVYEERARDETTQRPQREAGQEPMRASAARFGIAPSTLYRNLAEPPVPDAS